LYYKINLAKLFDDDTDPTQHIVQLKQKYNNMRKTMEGILEDLNHKKKDLIANNVSIKSKYDSIKKLEQESYEKLVSLDQSSQKKLADAENNHRNKNEERLKLEAENRLLVVDINNERETNQEYEFIIKANEFEENMRLNDFQFDISLVEAMAREKFKKIDEIEIKKVKYYNLERIGIEIKR
jgi:hypothetical protein